MAQVDVQKALSAKFPDRPLAFNQRDVIIYALGVGAQDLKYVYENADNFSALPTYPVVLMMKGDSFDVVPFGSGMAMPGIEGFDPMMILHGEQVLELKKPVPSSAKWIARTKIIGVYDKGKGALVVTETNMIDEKGEVAVRAVSSTFIRGIGGFGGPRGPKEGEETITIPNRAPDAVESEPTCAHQAWIYRLSADYNPLHIDPDVATMAGFKKPILHGLCSFGWFCCTCYFETFLW